MTRSASGPCRRGPARVDRLRKNGPNALVAAAVVIAVALVWSPRVAAQVAQLDPTFGAGGRMTTGVAGRDGATAIAVQPDGHIVVAGQTFAAGSTNGDFLVLRLTASGALDSTFGTGGRVVTDFGGDADYAAAVAIDSSGRILVGGTGGTPSPLAGSPPAVVARYLPDGSLDNAFGTNGRVSLPGALSFNGIACEPLPSYGLTSVGVAPDGTIAAAVALTGPQDFIGVARLLASGVPDSSFAIDQCSQGGIVAVRTLGNELPFAIDVQSSAVVVAGGWNVSEGVVLARLLPTGQLGGLAVQAPPSYAANLHGGAMARQADGKIVVVGTTQRPTGLTHRQAVQVDRFNADFTADQSFGVGGRAEWWIANGGLAAASVAVDASGRIVVAGCVQTGGVHFDYCEFQTPGKVTDFLVARFLPNGQLDTTFGTPLAAVDFAGHWDSAAGLAIQPDGRLLVAGTASLDGAGQTAVGVARLLGGTANCTPTLTPASRSVGRANGSGTVTVSLAAGCQWSASSNDPWMVISAGGVGYGPGSVTYVFAANDSTTPRSGSLTIGGQTFTLTQAAAIAPAISTSPQDTTVNVGANAVFVVAATGDPAPTHRWQMSMDAMTWNDVPLAAPFFGATSPTLTIQAVTSAMNNYRFRSVASNVAGAATSSAARLTVGAHCSYSSVIGEFILPPGGGSGFLDLVTGPTCPWTAGSSDAWLSVTPPSGTGSERITYAAAANTTGASRSATMSIAGRTNVIRQDRVTSTLTITTTSLPAAAVGAAYAATLAATGGTSPITWSLASGALPEGMSLSGTGVISGTASREATTSFAVQATDATGASVTRQLSMSVLPAAALVLSAAVVDRPNVTFTWTPPAGVTPSLYTLLASLSPGGPVVAQLPLGTQTSLTVAAPDGTFFIRIVAMANGVALTSNEIRVDIAPPAVPSAPTGIGASVTGSVITFVWQAPTGGTVAGYVLEAGTAPGLSNLATLPLGPVTSFVTPPVPNGSFYVRVRARNASGTGPASNDVRAVVGLPPPGPPVLSGVAGPGGSVALSWTAPTTGAAVIGYELHAGTASGLSDVAVISIPASRTSVAAGGVPSGTYVVRIVAASASGPGAFSNEVTLAVP